MSLKITSKPPAFIPFSIPRTSAAACTELAYEIRKFYQFCKNNFQEIEGSPTNVSYFDFTRKNIFLSPQNPHSYLKKIKLTAYISSANKPSGYELKFETDSFLRTYRIPCNNHIIYYKYFDGSEYEISYSRKKLQKQPLLNEHWSQWETTFSEASKFYVDHIYPKISITVDKLTTLLYREKVKILDLGGGSGRLAAKLLKDFPNKIETINLIDSNATLIKAAEDLTSQGFHQIIPHHLDITAVEFPPEEFIESSDIVILCGIVADQVLTKKQSYTLVEKAFKMLHSKGYLIVTSWSMPFLRKKNYKQISPNCEVLNTAFPFQNEKKNWNFHNFYVIKK